MKVFGSAIVAFSVFCFWRFGKQIQSDEEGKRSSAFIWIVVGVNCIFSGSKIMQAG